MRRKLSYLFAGLVLVAIVQMGYFYTYLPDTVASHFVTDGVADGWMSKQAFMVAHILCTVFLTLLFILAGILKLPAASKFISLPNRDYWLAHDRRQATELFLSQQARWFIFYTYLFLLMVFQLVINANLIEEKKLAEDQMWAALLIYGVYVVIWLVRFYRRFTLNIKDQGL